MTNFSNKDIELVMAQTTCTYERAVNSLHGNNGDLVDAIMELTAIDPTELWQNKLQQNTPPPQFADYREEAITGSKHLVVNFNNYKRYGS